MWRYPGGRVIDPIFDVGFKLIFGREKISERPSVISRLKVFRPSRSPLEGFGTMTLANR